MQTSKQMTIANGKTLFWNPTIDQSANKGPGTSGTGYPTEIRQNTTAVTLVPFAYLQSLDNNANSNSLDSVALIS
jgi:hypothetical protein